MKLSGFSKVKIVAVAAVILAAAGIGGWFYQSSVHKDTRVKASGTVEVTEIQLAPQAGGRIVEINIKAADYVKKGDLIARMSLDGSDHDVAMAEAALEAARQQLLELESGFRSEDVAKAKAETALRRTQYEQAARDAKRFKDLASDGVVSVREAERLVKKLGEDFELKTVRPKRDKSGDVRSVEEELSDLLAAQVEVRVKKRVKRHGKLEEVGELAIQFGSLEELNGLIDRLRG